MELGTLLRRLETECDAGAALESLGDMVLYCRVESMARRYGEAPGEYVANAARRFSATADDESWIGVVGAAGRSRDPARAVLQRMLEWALHRDAEESEEPCDLGGDGHDVQREARGIAAPEGT